MLSKSNRLQKKKDFDVVFKKGRGIKEDFLFLKIINNNLKDSRFGFIIPNKVLKKATQRNRIKRKLREWIKNNIIQIQKGQDIVLMVNSFSKEKENNLENTLKNIFLKAKLYASNW